MKKRIYFADFKAPRWPAPSELEPYFLGPKAHEWFFNRNDSWELTLEGVDGTEHLVINKGRIDVHLNMWLNRDLGVLIIYTKYGGGFKDAYSSKGDLTRLREWVRTVHGDRMPIGLYIPFPKAWKAVKEFMETDGELPKSIEWIANRDLPPNSFPEP